MRKALCSAGIFMILLVTTYHTYSQVSTSSDQELFEAGLTAYFEGEKLSVDEEALYLVGFADITSYYLEAIALFASIRSEGDLRKSVDYYNLLISSRIASWLYEDGLDSAFLADGVELLMDFDQFSQRGFPFYYYYLGTQYVVKYSNCEWARTDILNKLFVSAGRSGNFLLSLQYAREAYAIANNSAEQKFRALLFMLVSKESLGQFDAEQAELAIQYAEQFMQLNEADRALVSEWSPLESVVDVSMDAFSKAAAAQPALLQDAGKKYRLFEAIRQLSPQKAVMAAEWAMESPESLNRQQLFQLLEFGKMQKQSLGIRAADRLAQEALSCDEYNLLSAAYQQLQQPDKAQLMQEQEQKCRKQLAREQKRAQYVRPRLLLGTHAFQYLDDAETRDPGYELGILHKKSVYSVFYTSINDKAYQMIDLYLQDITTPGFQPRYDGYKAGFSIRKSEDDFSNRKWTYYYMLQFAYAEENIRPFDDQVTSLLDNQQFTQSFSPTDHSYRVYAGLGSTYYFYMLGIDLNFNIGFSLNTFDLKDQQHLYNENYSFSNPLLEVRKSGDYHFGTLMNVSIITYLLL